jgi:hypothetical protein
LLAAVVVVCVVTRRLAGDVRLIGVASVADFVVHEQDLVSNMPAGVISRL